MPIVLDNTSPIDPNHEDNLKMLSKLQGNILKSHGRNYARHLFLTFKPDKVKNVKNWIVKFTERYVTSAYRQHYETKEFKVNKISGRVFGGFYLSASGYEYLEFSDLDMFPEATDNLPKVFFKNGMNHDETINALGDPKLADREEGYEEKDKIHAFILLADNDPERLNDVEGRVKKSLEEVAEIAAREEGYVLRDKPTEPGKPGKAIEHFGYRDGISQPVFYKEEVDKEEDEEGNDKWDSFAPLKIILIKDPFMDEDDCFGSYLVFRKLEQNVEKFKKLEADLAETVGLNASESEKERAGALIIGRFKNGVPVISYESKDVPGTINFNNFNYSGSNPIINKTHNKCPYHAHIRKTNPRGDTIGGIIGGIMNEDFKDLIKHEIGRRITRRGITYGERATDPAGNPTMEDSPAKGVGLLFLCFQSDIPKQFGFLQARWANTLRFPEIGSPGGLRVIGLDPIIGQSKNGVEKQSWCRIWGDDSDERQFEFSNVITLKGGEFFFAPSIPFLRKLGA